MELRHLTHPANLIRLQSSVNIKGKTHCTVLLMQDNIFNLLVELILHESVS